MHKRLCACGCGERVTVKVESQHMNALAPGNLASQVLNQNRRLVHRKKKRKAIGFPAPVRQRLTTTETADMDMDIDDNDPVSLDFSEPMMMGEDIDENSKSFQNINHISQVDQNIYVDHAGPSGLTHDDILLPDPLHEDIDNAGMGDNLNCGAGPTNLRRSRRIAPHVKHSKSFQNISHQQS